VGARVDRTKYIVCTMQRHQVSSTHRLRCGVDGDPDSLAPIEHETWIMYFDGSIMKEGAGVGLVSSRLWACVGSTWSDYTFRYPITSPSMKH
jgi:hypothetical protein